MHDAAVGRGVWGGRGRVVQRVGCLGVGSHASDNALAGCLLCLARLGVGPLTHWLALRARGQGLGGGQWRLLCLACVGVRPLLRWLALRGRGQGQIGMGAARRSARARQRWRGVVSSRWRGNRRHVGGVGNGKLGLGLLACWRGRDPTINMRWKVEGGRGEIIAMGLGGGLLFI
jgi:hypothetical protein